MPSFASGEPGQIEHLIEHDGDEDDDQHIRQRIDDVDDTHHDQVGPSADIAGDTAIDHADDEHDEACEHADAQRDARAVDDADEIVAALLVGAEDVREAGAALVDILLLHLAVSKRSEVFRALVALAVDGHDLLIFIRDDHRRNDDRDEDDREQHQAKHGKRIFHQLAHTVAEERRALAHDVLLLFFLVRRLFEFLQIDLGAEDLLIRGYVGIVLLVHDAPSFTRI